MKQHTSLMSVATPDIEASRTFYVERLGWSEALYVPGDVLFLQTNHGFLLSLFDATNFNADIGETGTATLSGVTLAQNVGSPEEVDAILLEAAAAGATIVKPAQHAEWGGYHGHFADPNGLIWEIAHNPGLHFDADGSVRFEA